MWRYSFLFKYSWMFRKHFRDLSHFFPEKAQTANFGLQLRVCIFALSGFRVLAKHSLFSAVMLFFVKPQCFTYIYRPKDMRKNSVIQNSNWYITGWCRSLLISCPNVRLFNFKGKNLAVNQLPLEAFPALETWTANCKLDRKTVVTWHPQVCRLPLTMTIN